MEIEIIIPVLEFAVTNKNTSSELADLAEVLTTGSKPSSLSQELLANKEINNILILKPTPKFIKTEYLIFFYSLGFINQTILDYSEDNVLKFINSLSSKQFSKKLVNHSHYIIRYTLLLLNRYFNVNIPQFIGENKTSTIVQHAYWDLMPFLKSDSNHLITALYASSMDIKAEGNYIQLNHSVRETSKNNTGFGTELLQSCRSDFRKLEIFYSHAFLGLTSVIGIRNAFPLLRELLNSNKKADKIVGLKTLAWMHGYNDRPEEVESEIKPILEMIELENDDALSAQLIYVYGLLIEKLSNSREKLETIPGKALGPDTRLALSQIVMLKLETEYSNPWFRNALAILHNLNGQHTGTYRILSIAFVTAYPLHSNLFYDYINHYISESENVLRNIEGFRNVFQYAIVNDKKGFENWVTTSLNNDSKRYHRAVSFVLMMLDRKTVGEILLSPEIINELQPFDIEYILFKVVGNLVSKEHLQSLTFSALKYKGSEEFVGQLVKNLFCFYIMYNYPATIEYLRSKQNTASELEKKTIDEIEQYYNIEHRILTKKPLELSPSPKRMKKYFDRYGKEFQESDNDTPFKETSIFDLAKKITIKVGNAFFVRDKDYTALKNKYHNRSQMGNIAVEFDMPGGIYTDPVGQEYNRHLWRTAERRKL